MLGRDLAHLIQSGVRPVVTFKPPIDDKECYLEPGMRGRLVLVTDKHDDIFKLQVDLTEFDDFNRQFESANYFDKNGQACLTAREAGYLKAPQEDIYVGLDDEVDFCEMEDAARMVLYAEYQQQAAGRTYVQWLEDRVLAGAAK